MVRTYGPRHVGTFTSYVKVSNRGWYVNSLLEINLSIFILYIQLLSTKHWIDVSHDYQRVENIENELNYLLNMI